MKNVAIAIAAIALMGTPAFAADMPLKAPPAPPPVPVWTGWYVGGNVGYSWGDARTNIVGNGTVAFTAVSFTSPFGTFADSPTQRLQGVIGGGQFGYNYQINPKWVLGFETDIQASGERGSRNFSDPFSGSICNQGLPASCGVFSNVNGTASGSLDAKIRWFGTVRGRVGALINDQTLVYGTGGLAYGGVSMSGNVGLNGSITGGGLAIVIPFSGATAFSDAQTKVGFAVGGGVESKINWLPQGWTLKLEYLYLDLGSLNSTSSVLVTATPPQVTNTETITTRMHFTDNILRVGLNYQFH